MVATPSATHPLTAPLCHGEYRTDRSFRRDREPLAFAPVAGQHLISEIAASAAQ
jgi:hypothetical protein